MKRFLTFLVFTAICVQVNAQKTKTKTKAKTDAVKKTWVKGGHVGISLTQVGNRNWMAASGDKFSFSTIAYADAFATKKWKKFTWQSNVEFNYGIMNTSSLGVRKVNDRLDFSTKFLYQPKKWNNKWAWGAVGQLRSQFSGGYQYDYFGTGAKRRTSGFFAPAYVIAAPVGIEYHPCSWFSIYGTPAALRWTIVSNGPYSYATQGGIFHGNVETPLAVLYGVNPQTGNLGEFGTFITASLDKEILKNVRWKSKMDIFSNYLTNWNEDGPNPDKVAFFWKNQFTFTINKHLNVNYNIDVLNDNDIRNPGDPSLRLGWQALSTFGIGFTAKF